jgi:hypothetical protein
MIVSTLKASRAASALGAIRSRSNTIAGEPVRHTIVADRGDGDVQLDRVDAVAEVAVSKDGWLYVVANELNTLAALNDGTDVTTPPFYVHRLKLDGRS